MNKKLIFMTILIVLSLAFAVFAIDSRLKVVNYTLESEKISSPVRIAFISDLHSCNYGGEGQADLINAIREQNPDIVLFGGDSFDAKLDPEETFVAMETIAAEYPSYYSIGNHECSRSDIEEIFEKVQALGVDILFSENASVDIRGEKIVITGISDPGYYDSYIYTPETRMGFTLDDMKRLGSEKEEGFSVLLFHRPENFKDYSVLNFDLVLSGHAHGGQWRIPGVLNGLYAPNQGLFPEYAGGKYVLNDCTMIVSRGLAKESNWVPRIFNRPELVIIDIE